MSVLEMLAKMALAFLVGGIVGLERERRDRPAGLRTHMVVCAGSTLITLVSLQVGAGEGDPGRIAAQIVSGIGFLGAGTIFRFGVSVRGLTTAAGLWAVAGMGMAIGVGGDLIYVAVVTALFVFLANNWLRRWEERFARHYQELLITTEADPQALPHILGLLRELDVPVLRVEWLGPEGGAAETVVSVSVRIPREVDRHAVQAALEREEQVRNVAWD